MKLSIYFLLPIIFLCGYTALYPSEIPYSRFLDSQQNVNDSIVNCLGLTGIRIEGDKLNNNPDWPVSILTINSRQLQEVTNVIQGKINSHISWKMEGKRWEMYNPLLSAPTAKKIIQIGLKELKFKEPVLPKAKDYEGILILGALAGRVYERVRFANQITGKNGNIAFNKVYILTGKRPLEDTEKEQFPFLKGIKDEGAMTLEIFKRYANSRLQEKRIYVYSEAPQGSARATTESTVHAFMKENPRPGRYLGISNSYFIPYQELVIQNCLDRFYPNSGIRIECVGPGDKTSVKHLNEKELINTASVLLDNLSRIFYNLQIKLEHEKKSEPSRCAFT